MLGRMGKAFDFECRNISEVRVILALEIDCKQAGQMQSLLSVPTFFPFHRILFNISNDPIEVCLVPDDMLVIVAMPDGRPGRLEQVVDLSRADGLLSLSS